MDSSASLHSSHHIIFEHKSTHLMIWW